MIKEFKKYHNLFQKVNSRRLELLHKGNRISEEEKAELDFCNFIANLFVDHAFPHKWNMDYNTLYSAGKILKDYEENYYCIIGDSGEILRPVDDKFIFMSKDFAEQCLDRHKDCIKDFKNAKIKKVKIIIE